MKKAFTLIELLVVIGIIAVLMGVLLSALSGTSDAALNAQCLSNMKNLATAAQAYGSAKGHFPLAGSVEKSGVQVSVGNNGSVKRNYWELPGWISWNSKGAYDSSPKSHVASADWFVSAYNTEHTVREHCYTNAALWKYIAGNSEVFRCPVHAIWARKKLGPQGQTPPAWSYVMNSYFGWDSSQGQRPKPESWYGIEYTQLKHAERRLLLAELPFAGYEGADIDTSSGSGTVNDCTLQYRDKDGGETIGFNHTAGKRDKCAHLVFADGHTETILLPKKGADRNNLRELTKWLCEGKDVSFNGDRYEELDN